MSTPNTLYLIAYDIQSDKRRTKVHKLLSAYGEWKQYSLFECHLSRLQRLELQHKLDTILESDKDNVRLYPLCQSCLKKVEVTIGAKPKEPDIFLL